MKNKVTSIEFKLKRITTEEFAIVPSAYTPNEKITFSPALGFGVDPDRRILTVFIRIEFNQKGNVFVVIDIGCHFEIKESFWKKLYSKTTHALTLPKEFSTHLALITVGTVRGVLHAKTENSDFQFLILPPLDLTKMIKEDIFLDLE